MGILPVVSTPVGQTWTVAQLLELGERCSNVERALNVREGLRRRDDRLPRRLLEEPMPEGPTEGEVVDLEPMLDAFYAACGWDIDSGIPTAEKLRSLDLGPMADDLWP